MVPKWTTLNERFGPHLDRGMVDQSGPKILDHSRPNISKILAIIGSRNSSMKFWRTWTFGSTPWWLKTSSQELYEYYVICKAYLKYMRIYLNILPKYEIQIMWDNVRTLHWRRQPSIWQFGSNFDQVLNWDCRWLFIPFWEFWHG